MKPLEGKELEHAQQHVLEIRARYDRLKAAGVCPSCQGTKQNRVTRFPDGTRESRFTSMEPCYRCGGSGTYPKQAEERNEDA